MKKYFCRLLALLLVTVLMFTMSGFDFISSEDTPSIMETPAEVKAAMELQLPALDAYQTLLNNLGKDEMNNPVYPDEYGGEYIDGDQLVILLVGRNYDTENKYRKLCGYSKNVTFNDVQYSLNYLNSMDKLAFSLSNKYRIVSYGVDRRNNNYIICVSNKDYKALISDESVVNSKGLIRVEASEEAVPCYNLYGGDRITYSDSSSYYSVCIGGTYNGSDAILTAGHGNEGSPDFYRSGTLIGQVSYQRCNTNFGDTGIGSLGDFAIVSMNGNYTSTNKVRNAASTVSIGGTYSSVPVGTTIYKYGSTSGYSWGTVQYVSITVQYSDWLGLPTYEVRGLYQSYMQNSSSTDAISPGDSGGSVYMQDGSIYKIHGCVSGRMNPIAGQVAHTMYSSPIYYAVDAGFTPRTN